MRPRAAGSSDGQTPAKQGMAAQLRSVSDQGTQALHRSRQYRTRTEAEYTGLGGSSLGGLATLALGLWFPNVFTPARRACRPRFGGTTARSTRWWRRSTRNAAAVKNLARYRHARSGLGTRAGVCATVLWRKDGGSMTISITSKRKVRITAKAPGRQRLDAVLRFLFPPPLPIIPGPRRRSKLIAVRQASPTV